MLQSYLSKGKVSDIQLPNTPVKVNFSVHPNQGEFKHEVRQFQKPYDNQQAEQISLMV